MKSINSIEVQAPNPIPRDEKNGTVHPQFYSDYRVFLAGSIEMGVAEQWQDAFIARYPHDVFFLNPRRADWDSTWDHNSAQFDEQVNWELDMMEIADIVVMYFDPNTKSPISMLELGLHADKEKLIVCCPDGFWRQGNVRIVCQRNNIPYFTSKEEWLNHIDTILTPGVDFYLH